MISFIEIYIELFYFFIFLIKDFLYFVLQNHFQNPNLIVLKSQNIHHGCYYVSFFRFHTACHNDIP